MPTRVKSLRWGFDGLDLVVLVVIIRNDALAFCISPIMMPHLHGFAPVLFNHRIDR